MDYSDHWQTCFLPPQFSAQGLPLFFSLSHSRFLTLSSSHPLTSLTLSHPLRWVFLLVCVDMQVDVSVNMHVVAFTVSVSSGVRILPLMRTQTSICLIVSCFFPSGLLLGTLIHHAKSEFAYLENKTEYLSH